MRAWIANIFPDIAMNRTMIALAALASTAMLSACGGAENTTAASGETQTEAAPQPSGVGSITGTIGGDPVKLYVVGSQSDHTNASISIYARGDDLKERGYSAFRIGGEWIGSIDGGFHHTDATIDIADTNPSRVYEASDEDGLALTITKSDYGGDTLDIAGTVKGTLTRKDLMGGRNADATDTKDVDLTFEARLNKL